MPVPAGAGSTRAYATEAEYAEWLGLEEAPAGAATALLRASRMVDQMLISAVYDVDDDSLPTDVAVAEALRDATLAQAEYARANRDASMVGAVQATQVSIGSLSYTRASGTAGTAGGGAGRWSPLAWQILQQAGLTSMSPLSW